ncbi:MAG: rod-binding protein [Rhizobiales bacterium]|nr:rod-binding protein [Hyphomicrobiales bacterium]
MSDIARLPLNLPPLSGFQGQFQASNGSARSAPNGEPATPGEIAARTQANEFEATFLASLLQPIFEGLAKDRTFGGGFGEETFTGLLTQEYAKSVAGSANLGIADQVYEQLLKLQENSGPVDLTPLAGGTTPRLPE